MKTAKTEGVDYVLPCVNKLRPLWAMIRAVLEGERAIKAGKTKYLPMPNPEDDSDENKKRYDAYRTRAVWYAFTYRTLTGMVGQVFFRAPVIYLPKGMDWMLEDVDGGGISLIQQSKRAVEDVTSIGRCGLLTDYPKTEGPASAAELAAGKIRPTICFIQAENIINWRTITVGSKRLLSLVVIKESYICKDNGFCCEYKPQYRVLRLERGENGEGALRYTVEIWREEEEGTALVVHDKYTPTMGNGQPWDHIPFRFIGSIDNDPEPDKPPLEDLAQLNIAHYRNSADYEEASFMVGQPTPWASGLTEEWVKDVMKGEIYLGSRGLIPLPQGGQAGLLQASPNTMPMEAMVHKERQAVALGAKLVEQQQVQRTATEVSGQSVVENSTLAQVATNVSEAYTKALWDAALYTTFTGEIEFGLNTDFEIINMTAQERQQLISEWQSGAISFEEMRYGLKQAGVAYLDDQKAKNQIAGEENGPDLDDIDEEDEAE